MEPLVLDWKQIEPERDFVYGEPNKMGSNRGTIVPLKVRYNDQLVPFYVATPLMNMPFGITEFNMGSWSADLTFPGVRVPEGQEFTGDDDWEGPEELVGFLKWVRKVEQCNLMHAHSHAKAYFRKEFSIEMTQQLMKRNLSDSSDPHRYSPILHMGLKSARQQIATTFWNSKAEPIESSAVSKGTQCRALLFASGIWFASNNFGMKFKAEQCMIVNRPRFTRCAFPPVFGGDEEDCEEPTSPKCQLTSDESTTPGVAPNFNM